LYSYQQLSNSYYAPQKDSLRKAWVCPEVFDDRSAQKKFRELWDERTTFLATAIEKQYFVYEPEVNQYLQGIIGQITAANAERFSDRPLLLIDRSPVANAYALGGNVLIVNLGLICFSQTREELALAIAHELSHNILSHCENALKEKAKWLTSDEYRNSLKGILDSKYERYSRLKNIFRDYRFSRSKHQRYHESDADSLAIVLLKNAHIPFKAEYFLRLDSTDLEYIKPLKQPLKYYFTIYGLTADESWMQVRRHGLSTASHNFSDTSSISDSLKTHPDCIDRYARTNDQSDLKAPTTPIPSEVSDRAIKMLIYNMFDNMNLTACLYRIFEEKDKGRTDSWYDFMVSAIFSGLYYEDEDLHRFNAIGIKSKEYISAEYYQLQTMLEQIPADNLRNWSVALNGASFWTQRPEEDKAMKQFLSGLAVTGDNADKVRRNSAEAFISSNVTSMYCEFADHFRKK
jgi:hypothetical protein